ncbi:MAG: MlaD family protein [Longimicrobiales bacterium]|nr:MlaD family protein [Longimicrobiales bacterium]
MTGRKELLVGSVIIIALAVAVGGTLWLQGTNFGRPTIPVDALFESVGQLSEGNPVTYRGVRIGQVSDIEVEAEGLVVRVTLLMEQAVRLPGDAAVVLGPESLFGDWQAEIVSRGSFPRFDFYEVPEDQAEDVLGGYALPEITRLTASAEQISDNLADLTNRMELAFNEETANNLATAIANIEDITEEVRTLVRQQGVVAASITSSADSALDEMEAAARAARSSFERVDGVLAAAEVDSLVIELHAAASGVRRLSDQLSNDTTGLSATLERADSAFVRIDRIVQGLEAGEGSLGRLLNDTTFAARAVDVLETMDLLLVDVRENPRRYVRLSIF